MYEGQEGIMGSLGIADNAISADEICKKCNKPSPPNEVSIPANENVDWL